MVKFAVLLQNTKNFKQQITFLFIIVNPPKQQTWQFRELEQALFTHQIVSYFHIQISKWSSLDLSDGWGKFGNQRLELDWGHVINCNQFELSIFIISIKRKHTDINITAHDVPNRSNILPVLFLNLLSYSVYFFILRGFWEFIAFATSGSGAYIVYITLGFILLNSMWPSSFTYCYLFSFSIASASIC